MLGQCVKCGAAVSDGSNFCNLCGMPVTSSNKVDQLDEKTETTSMLLLGLAFMALFFSFGFALPAAMAEPGFWTLSIILAAAGLLMLLARFLIVWRYRRKMERTEKEAIVKCQYCGEQNNRKIGKCIFCGAPLK